MVRSSRTVLVVDPDPLCRASLVRQIVQAGNVDVLEAGDAATALYHVRDRLPQVVLVNAELGASHSSALAASIFHESGATRPQVLATCSSEPRSRFAAQQLVQAGACGILSEDLTNEEVVDAVRKLLGTPRDAHKPPRQRDAERLALLSVRERDILERVANGATSRAIATELGIQQRTVEVHRHHILRKLQLNGVTDLVKFAIRVGLTRV